MPAKERSVDKQLRAPAVPTKTEYKKSLDPERQRKLEEILERETMRTKTEQIKKILEKKMVLKYGRIHLQVIKSSIDEVIGTADKIKSDTLERIEALIRSRASVALVQSADNNQSNNNSYSTNNLDSENDKSQQRETVSSTHNSRQTTPSMSSSSLPVVKGAEWQILATYEKVVSDEKEKKLQEKARLNRLKFKQSLDDHMYLSKELKKSDNQDDVVYSQHVNQDVQQYHIDEQQKQLAIKQHHMELLRLRQEQIKEQERRKQEERIKSRQFEAEIIETAQQKLQREKEIILEMKKRDKDIRAQIEKDNIENKKILAIMKQKEQEEDQRLMREYAAKLDREAYERDHAFQKRMEHIDKSSLQFALEGAGKIALEEEKQREALQMKELQHAIEKEQEIVRKKEYEKKMNLQKMLADNHSLIESRELQKRSELEKKVLLSQQYKEDLDHLTQEQLQDKMNKLKKQQQYNQLLSAQLSERDKYRLRTEEMVEREKMINREKLNKAMNNKEILNILDPNKPPLMTIKSMAPI